LKELQKQKDNLSIKSLNSILFLNLLCFFDQLKLSGLKNELC
jgi:hypothetical protein